MEHCPRHSLWGFYVRWIAFRQDLKIYLSYYVRNPLVSMHHVPLIMRFPPLPRPAYAHQRLVQEPIGKGKILWPRSFSKVIAGLPPWKSRPGQWWWAVKRLGTSQLQANETWCLRSLPVDNSPFYPAISFYPWFPITHPVDPSLWRHRLAGRWRLIYTMVIGGTIVVSLLSSVSVLWGWIDFFRIWKAF